MKYACILGAFLILVTGCASEVTVLGPTSGAGGAGSATSGGNGGNSTSSESASVVGVTTSVTGTSTASGDPSPDATILCTEVCELLNKCEVVRFAECMDGCVPDLGDCSSRQVEQIEACLDKVEQCSGVNSFFDCADDVTCTDG
jgi:hypothetical protein